MRTRPHPDLPADLTGHRIVWCPTFTSQVSAGTVVADRRTTTVKDRRTLERVRANLVIVEDTAGVHHEVPAHWIEHWDG